MTNKMAGPDLGPPSSRAGEGRKVSNYRSAAWLPRAPGRCTQGVFMGREGGEGLGPSPFPEGTQLLLKLQPGPRKAQGQTGGGGWT